LLWSETVSGVVVAGACHSAWRADFSFRSADKFPARRRAIRWEISPRNVEGPDAGARNELVTGNGPSFCGVFSGLFRESLPVIGVRREIVQCRAHDDDDRAAPAVAPAPAPGAEIPMASAFQLPAPE
jgi:hypothetical protein